MHVKINGKKIFAIFPVKILFISTYLLECMAGFVDFVDGKMWLLT